MEKISWLDTLTNKEVRGRANEKWANAELLFGRGNGNGIEWIGYVLRHDSLLHEIKAE